MLSAVGGTLAFDGCSPFLNIRWLIDLRFSRRRSLFDLGALFVTPASSWGLSSRTSYSTDSGAAAALLLAHWRTPGTFLADTRWQWPSLWRLSFLSSRGFSYSNCCSSSHDQ
jgi:hypothetical protein